MSHQAHNIYPQNNGDVPQPPSEAELASLLTRTWEHVRTPLAALGAFVLPIVGLVGPTSAESAAASTPVGITAEAPNANKNTVDKRTIEDALVNWRIMSDHNNFSEEFNADLNNNGYAFKLLEGFKQQLTQLDSTDPNLPAPDLYVEVATDVDIFLKTGKKVEKVSQMLVFGTRKISTTATSDGTAIEYSEHTAGYENISALYLNSEGQWQHFSFQAKGGLPTESPSTRWVGQALKNGDTATLTPSTIIPSSVSAGGFSVATANNGRIDFAPAETFPSVKKAAKTLLGTNQWPEYYVSLGAVLK